MSHCKRILIVGGVAGGASAAARARRLSEDAQIILLERGEFVSFANCGMPYHIGQTIKERDRLLVQTPQGLSRRYNIEVRTRTEVVRIDRQRRQVIVRDLASGKEQAEPYDELILSPGAEPIRPPIPGVGSPRVLTLRSLADMDAIKKVVDGLPAGGSQAPAVRAVIVGGGYIGLEMAEALRGRGLAVTLVELTNQVFGVIDPEMAAPVHQQLTQHGVDLRLGTSVTGFSDDGRALQVLLSTGETIECGLAILSVGVRPEVALAREAGLAIGQCGGIVVDEHMRTGDEHIYAVGDAVEVTDLVGRHQAHIPLAGPANRQGRIAADNALGRDSVYRHSQGTAICKVFDLAVGMTGLSEKALKRLGRPYEKVYVHPASHASYYPGASPISLKLLFDPASGKVLGAQAVGTSGVDKRIDVLAVAIRAGMTVLDLQDLELCYAPPYGSAKDAVNYAGFVASNAIKGDVKLCHAADALSPRDDQKLLDVRTPAEVAAGTIPGAINIPLDELRSRLGELPRDKELLAFCQVGLRGYLACRILQQNGFKCRNLSGGYKTYAHAAAAVVAAPVKPTTPGDPSNSGRIRDHTGESGPAPAGGSGAAAGGASCCGGGPGKTASVVKHVDATGLQCPGPIMRLKKELDALADGQTLTITASDPAFAADIVSWCHNTGNQLVNVRRDDGKVLATITRRVKMPSQESTRSAAAATAEAPASRRKTIVVFSSDFDKLMAAFIIANGAAAMGSDVTMFFTFWGLNSLRKGQSVPVRKTFIERALGWMMPRGADKLKLSRMNMGGMGLAMIKGIMRKKNVPSLRDLIGSAKAAGVRLVACTMSMDLMGIKKEELIDGVEEGGVAMYLDQAESGNVNLFI